MMALVVNYRGLLPGQMGLEQWCLYVNVESEDIKGLASNERGSPRQYNIV